MTDRPSDRATPRFHGDDGSDRISALRREFEDWYVGAAFDYTANPIGSQNCDLQWRAWLASRLAAAPDGVQTVYQRRCIRHTYCSWVEISRDEYEAAQSHGGQYSYRSLHTAPTSLSDENAAPECTKASVAAMQSKMADHGFTVPVRVIAEAIGAARAAEGKGHG